MGTNEEFHNNGSRKAVEILKHFVTSLTGDILIVTVI